MFTKITLLFVLMTIINTAATAQAHVRFRLTIPSDIPTKTDNIFLAGSFNGWSTADKDYRFKKDKKGTYTLDIPLNKGMYEYKAVRGDWSKCEVSKTGESIENRELQLNGDDTTVTIGIQNWADNFQTAVKKSTAATNVHFLDTAFLMPQLQRTRRVWIYLPQDYFTSSKKYPVIYMQDGQNVFDDATSFSGEWGVDDYLNTLPVQQQCIVVAIDNGGSKRMTEYNPYNNKRFGKAEGTAYTDFLANTLKPFIDKHYRTLKDTRHTAVAGSSMGGLISFYAAMKYPKTFGIGGVFSPSFWIAPKLKSDLKKAGAQLKHNYFYFYGGNLETDSMVQNIIIMQKELQQFHTVKTRVSIDKDGIHNETFWRKDFPGFYTWCLKIWQEDVY